MIWIALALAVGLGAGVVLVRWGMNWGSTQEERALEMPGDDFLEGGPGARVAMTRAITIRARPRDAWPWVAQLGRGAGWYSFDRLDNGGKVSARHVVSWIPEPRLGDATAIGYLRHLDPDRALAWWLDGGSFIGSAARLVTSFNLRSEEHGTRLVSRISADATGPTAALALLAFRVIDSIMACRQLVGLRERVEAVEAAREESAARGAPELRDPETGKRDQYQLYEILYADGGSAGVVGKESGARWRRAAIRDGVLESNEGGEVA